LGLHLRPRWEAYSTLPDSLAGFKGPTFKKKRREEMGKRGEG